MPRILLLIAVIAGVFWWLRHRAHERRTTAAHRAAPRRPSAPQESMVQCAQCGVHLPASDAIAFRGLHYCQRGHLPADAGEAMRDDQAA